MYFQHTPPPIIFVHFLTLCFKKRFQVHEVHCLCQPWHFLMELWFPLVEKCAETKALCFHCYWGEAVFSYSQVRELGNIYKWNHIYAYLFTNMYLYLLNFYISSLVLLLCYYFYICYKTKVYLIPFRFLGFYLPLEQLKTRKLPILIFLHYCQQSILSDILVLPYK